MNLTLRQAISSAITGAAFLLLIGLMAAPILFPVIAGLLGVKGQGVGICAP